MSSAISWAEHATMISINPDAATRDVIAQMATELSEIMNYIATDGRYGEPPVLDGVRHGGRGEA